MLIEIDSGGNENSRIVILMRIPLLSRSRISKNHQPDSGLCAEFNRSRISKNLTLASTR